MYDMNVKYRITFNNGTRLINVAVKELSGPGTFRHANVKRS